MKLLTCGCSMTRGDDLKNPELDSWSVKLSSLLNCSLENIARSGCDNTYIFRSVFDYINTCDSEDLMVCIGWTFHTRKEIFSKDILKSIYISDVDEKNNLINITTKNCVNEDIIINFFKQYDCVSIWNILQIMRYKLLLIEYCNHNKIPIIMFDSIKLNINNDYLNKLYSKYDLYNNYLNKLNSYKQWINESYLNFSILNKFKISNKLHPLEEANNMWAYYLYNYIINNEILKLK